MGYFQFLGSVVARIATYFGFAETQKSPLTLEPPVTGKYARIRDVKRAEAHKLVESCSAAEIKGLIAAGSDGWKQFARLRMNDAEIIDALTEQLKFKRRQEGDQVLFFRRRVCAGLLIVGVGVWVIAIAALLRQFLH